MEVPVARVVAALLGVLLLTSAASVCAQDLSSDQQIAQTASVRNVKLAGGVVSGALVNHSSKLLRNVRVLIRYTWIWKNERHPGSDNPARAEYVTFSDEVPARGTLRFTHHINPPLPERADGRFTVSVDVISFTEVG